MFFKNFKNPLQGDSESAGAHKKNVPCLHSVFVAVPSKNLLELSQFACPGPGIYGSQSREDYSEDDVEHYFNYMGMLATEVPRLACA